MGLDRRMADEDRLKTRAINKARMWGRRIETSPREVGRHYTTHGAYCSCFACGNPRKYFSEQSLSERRHFQEE